MSAIVSRTIASAEAVLMMAAVAVFTAGTAMGQADACASDLDGDGVVGGADLSMVLGNWGPCELCEGDVNGDHIVDGVDLAFVLTRWAGACAPTVTGVTPNGGPIAGGVEVMISGANLLNPLSVTFDSTPATIVASSGRSISVFAPPTVVAGPATITVTTLGGSCSKSGFIYHGAPTIIGLVPNVGYAGGGQAITVSGSGFFGVPSVQFGGSQATSVSVVSPTQLVVVAPPGEIGSAVSLTVTTLSGVASLPEAFSYIAISVPAWATLLDPAPDPTIVTNEEIRDAIVGTRHAWRVRDNTTQAEMVLIPPGSFSMGCSASKAWDCGSEETPVHAVSLTNAFYLSRHEVTQAQWQATMGSNPSGFQGHPDSQHRPVERVSWDMIQGYLSMTGTRLPTEAEWEYAYRAGTTTAFHGFAGHPNGTNDESLVESIGWSVSNASSRTHPVGGKAPNGFGLFDMSGNVQEWVSDWFSADYYLTSSLTNPTGPASGQYRVLRGGHWGNGLGALRSSWRNWDWPHTEVSMYGFRIARNP